ncbi:MAG: MFS transporter [Sphingomonadales bacterium]|nr:MAG: MFS transporter [Sphingomonadales bacterium]
MTGFYRVLANNFLANITNFTVWVAATFWVYLETESVFATGMVAGLHLVLTALLAMWFGSLVDHNPKKLVLQASSLGSFVFFAAALATHSLAPDGSFTSVGQITLWLFILLVMLGVIAGNLRNIALPTLVTQMVPEDERDKANGLVGVVTGTGVLITSAISGFLVSKVGITGVLVLALGLTSIAWVHLFRFEVGAWSSEQVAAQGAPKQVDVKGTIIIVRAVPGLFALIFFSTFNNLLGGVFIALMDAYGLSLMTVQEWGVMWALVSCAFIFSGILIARTGLGGNPLRTLLVVNLLSWVAASIFTIQSSIPLLITGCFLFLFLGPYAEAAEQTTLQKVVPVERQGRVFGFAQSVELAASPLMAFIIGPLTQFVFIPFMTSGAGADLIGDWYGRGPERGIALAFTLAGLTGVAGTSVAFRSSHYRRLSAIYLGSAAADRCKM